MRQNIRLEFNGDQKRDDHHSRQYPDDPFNPALVK
jgi:hypothetical protein